MNKQYFKPIILLTAILSVGAASGQPRFQQDDFTTYTDSRNAWCIDAGWREIFIATDGGIWRFSRFTGEILTPWFQGVGLNEAIPLTGGRVILWHQDSETLWLATTGGLVYWRSDFNRWYRYEDIESRFERIYSLGDAGDLILVETAGSKGIHYSLDPSSLRVREYSGDPPENTRWTGKRGWQKHEFPRYFTSDFSLSFDWEYGTVKDWEHDVFTPVYEFFNEPDQRRYICYPGLGIGVADERRHTLDVIQPGPAGRDVKSIALAADGIIYTAGENSAPKSGFSTCDRATGRWSRYSSNLIPGLDSHRAWDVLAYKNWIYFATDQGLVCFDIEHGEWQTLDRFDGLAGLELRAVAGCRGIIFVGGDRGLNRVKTPTGPIWNSGFKAADELVTSEILVKDDTIWAAGVQGIVQLPAAAVGEQEIEGCFFDREPAKCLEIKEDFVWIGTTYGIKIFNRKSREWSELSRDIYLNRGNTLDLEANDSLLFIGTDKGLFRYNYRRNRWQEYGLREGLPHLRVQRLVLEADTLWIGTPVGLTRFIWNRPDRDVD